MQVNETIQLTNYLRRYTKAFEQCIAAGKNVEARTYLPIIRKACEELKMDWKELLGSEYNRFFTDVTVKNGYEIEDITVSQNDKKPQITVTSDINRCLNCQKYLTGRRKGTKFCNNQCKNNYHQ